MKLTLEGNKVIMEFFKEDCAPGHTPESTADLVYQGMLYDQEHPDD